MFTTEVLTHKFVETRYCYDKFQKCVFNNFSVCISDEWSWWLENLLE